MARRIHVVPYGDAWAVKQEGADRASAITDTQREAINKAQQIARGNDEVIVHNRQGQITKGKKYSNKNENSNRSRNSGGSGCFITTACVNYYNLPDDCYQLNTLRSFRDSYLSNTAKGKSLVKLYYEVAPKIVKCLNVDPNKESLYQFIYSQINLACAYIENKRLAEAKRLYEKTVRQLAKHFQVA